MRKLNTVGKILMKVLEVFHWVGAGLMAAAAVCALAAPQYIGWFVDFDAKECCGAELAVYGFSVQAPVVAGNVDMTAFFLFGIGAVAILAVMALVFRNLHLVFKRAGETTPFHPENITRMKKIGFFSMAVPVAGFVMSLIIRWVIGEAGAEISVDQSGIFMGIIVLCLTQFFAHGNHLEQDVDGLV